MPVPDYQTLMRPLLAYYGDGQERRISSVRDSLARDFALTPTDLEERIPSGRAKTFHNRVGWATTYLYRTGLLERPARSLYGITPRGRRVLEANPDRIDLGVLDQFPEFREFRDARKGVSGRSGRLNRRDRQAARRLLKRRWTPPTLTSGKR